MDFPDRDPEFEALLPVCPKPEFEALRTSIARDGVRDPIVIWQEKNLIMDGHTRLNALAQHLGVPIASGQLWDLVDLKYLSFASREDARNWIFENALARRALPKMYRSYAIGKQYLALRREDLGHGNQKSGGQNVRPTNSNLLAGRYGYNEKTIRRYGQLARAVDECESIYPGSRDRLLRSKVSWQAIVKKGCIGYAQLEQFAMTDQLILEANQDASKSPSAGEKVEGVEEVVMAPASLDEVADRLAKYLDAMWVEVDRIHEEGLPDWPREFPKDFARRLRNLSSELDEIANAVERAERESA